MVTVIADDWDDLTDGELQNPIDTDENSVWLGSTVVWTSTLTSGEPNPALYFCDDWSDTSDYAWRGFTDFTDEFWTEVSLKYGCGDSARLYCFEQE
jgi:hypothetical protein